VHQSVRRDIARSIKCTSGRIDLLIRPTFQRGFQFRDRRIARAARRIDEDARFGLTSLATHLKPTVTTIEKSPDRRRWLRRSAVTFHSQGLHGPPREPPQWRAGGSVPRSSSPPRWATPDTSRNSVLQIRCIAGRRAAAGKENPAAGDGGGG
jgi:hypothetical protein